MAKRRKKTEPMLPAGNYDALVGSIAELLEASRRTTARAVNNVLTATYWEIGRQIVEFEQGGKTRAEYGENLLKQLARDLTARFGRGFSRSNLQQMRLFYRGWEICQTVSGEFEAAKIVQTPPRQFEARVRLPAGLLESVEEICSTPSGKSPISQTPSGMTPMAQTPSAQFQPRLLAAFPLAWSHYVRLMSVDKPHARAFYESEAIRGGWSVRQLDRQISTQFFERTAKSKQQTAMRARAQKAKPEDIASVADEIRDPYVLEFLDLKDEYSESELEDALIRHLESFLLELGAGFTFVARQKRIRIGTEWYRIDLLLFHRRLKCLVVIDLKIGKFSHADAGQMSLYLTYAREHMSEAGENDPVGLILCSEKDDAVVHYSMGHMPAKVFASKYLTQLPDEETLRREIQSTKRALTLRPTVHDIKR